MTPTATAARQKLHRHVDVPTEVRAAYAALQPVYGTRAANPAFASR